MAPPPVPAAGNPIPPPLFNIVFVFPGSGKLTPPAISFLTQFWAAMVGNEGLTDQVAIIQGLHGDGTLSPLGVLTVTKTNGVAFGYFATGTDAANLSGTLAAARIADGSLPYAKLVNAAGAMLLGASGAGPLVPITIGAGLAIVGGALVDEATIVTTVAGLPAQPYPQGCRRFVSDATAPAFGAAVVGLGAVPIPVFSDGAAWRVG